MNIEDTAAWRLHTQKTIWPQNIYAYTCSYICCSLYHLFEILSRKYRNEYCKDYLKYMVRQLQTSHMSLLRARVLVCTVTIEVVVMKFVNLSLQKKL